MISVKDKYDPLFMRQPNVYSTSVGYFTDANGEPIDTWGIKVKVSKKEGPEQVAPRGPDTGLSGGHSCAD